MTKPFLVRTLADITLEMLVDAVAERLAERLAEREESLVDQRDPRGLMGRRHIEAVRRRRSEGAGGAHIRGRSYLLTPQANREELERSSGGVSREARAARGKPSRPSESEARGLPQSERERIRRELESDMLAARAACGVQPVPTKKRRGR